MKKKVICIDITNAIPGKGGTGGGITTYAINLVKNLDDHLDESSPTVYCLKNVELTNFPPLKNIIVVAKKVTNTNLLSRLDWLNLRLPLFCLSKKVDLLHRIVPELPVIKVCRYVITMHDFMFDFYLERKPLRRYLSKQSLLRFKLFQFMGKMALRISDGIIVPAETIKKEVENRVTLSGTKVVVIHSASEHSIHDKEFLDSNFLTIGVVAGFHPHKGHLRVIRVARHFLDLGFTNFKILMRGSRINNEYIKDIEKAIRENGLEQFVEFEAFVKRTTLEEIYSKYNIVMLLSEYEGFGLPVLEAQAHSIPVVCSDIPIFREVLQDSAFYLPEEFNSSHVSQLLTFISDMNLRKEMVRRGKENLERFSWPKMAKESLALYTVLMS